MESPQLPFNAAELAPCGPAAHSVAKPTTNLVLPEGALWCFDLGTSTGVYFRKAEARRSWTVHWATKAELEEQRREGKDRTLDVRFDRYLKFLLDRIYDGDTVTFEDVGFSSPRMSSHSWASFRSAIWALASLRPGVRVVAVPVGTLKQFAAGKTSADKRDMARALARYRPQEYKLVQGDQIQKVDGTIADHNEVDAIWLGLYAEAVERGERSLLSAYDRKQLKIVQRREKKAQRRFKRRLKNAAKVAHAKARQRALRFAIKSLGTCCGVFRKQHYRQAICSKCGSQVPLPKIHIPISPTESVAPRRSSQIHPQHCHSEPCEICEPAEASPLDFTTTLKR